MWVRHRPPAPGTPAPGWRRRRAGRAQASVRADLETKWHSGEMEEIRAYLVPLQMDGEPVAVDLWRRGSADDIEAGVAERVLALAQIDRARLAHRARETDRGALIASARVEHPHDEAAAGSRSDRRDLEGGRAVEPEERTRRVRAANDACRGLEFADLARGEGEGHITRPRERHHAVAIRPLALDLRGRRFQR